MIRDIRMALYLLVGLLLGTVVTFSYAETIPATAPAGTMVWRNNNNVFYQTPLLACQTMTGASLYTNITATQYNATLYNCNGLRISTGVQVNAWLQTDGQAAWAYFCPVGQSWTLVGSGSTATCTRPNCTLPATRDPADGICKIMKTCVLPEVLSADGLSCRSTCFEVVITPSGSCVKAAPCTSADPVENTYQAKLATALGGALCSDKATSTECPAGGIKIGTAEGGKPLCLTPFPPDPACTAAGGTVTGTLNGSPVCDKGAANPMCADGTTRSDGVLNGQPVCQASCAPGTKQGTVNGVSSCYPIGKVTPKISDQKSSDLPSSEKINGIDVGSKSKTTTCVGERCTTKEVITDSNGQPTTTETTQDKGKYCLENPKATICTGATEEQKYCEDNPEVLGCMTAGTPETATALTEQAFNLTSITPVSIASNMTCPASVALPRGWGSLSYEPACDLAGYIRPIMLLLAWMTAGIIVVGALRT